ncbi:MAG TPA: glycine cleavage system aminomethyltransferase GcvT [Candidatus Dormibacteraeota bacterium]|nr:glycine cleavage system aminomethyltransferase GcvT [Candidatus Dormibacteraeota bacterium]
MTTSAPNLTGSIANRTPLFDRHVALGGRMVDFGGWELPQQYTSIRDEHLAVRKVAGLFDISHMGRVELEGVQAEANLQRLFTNDLARLAPGHAIYTLMCKEDGGVLDDLVVYRKARDNFLIVVNAANREKDVAWMRDHLATGVSMADRTSELSLIALQGPQAHAQLPEGSTPTDDIPYFGFEAGKVAGVPTLISRTGYTGEDGFELFVASDQVGRVWDAILEAGKPSGVLPAGLGARDATRLEAALRLYGNDMDETVNPYEAGLGWTVKLEKGNFIGRDALAKIRESGARRTLIGLTTEPGSIPRHGAAVMSDGRRAGVVTSGTHSFFLGHPIALAMVEVPSFPVGDMVAVEVRGREASAKVVKLPFYRGSSRSAVSTAKT